MPNYAASTHNTLSMMSTLRTSPRRWNRTVARTPDVQNAMVTLDRAVLTSNVNSEFLTRMTIFDGAINALDELDSVVDNWDSYNSPAPSEQSIIGARLILDGLRAEFVLPERVLPSAEGGVALTFLSKNENRAVIESLNNGERFVLLYDRKGNSATLDWPHDEQKPVLDRLKEHLRGSSLAAS